MKALARWAMTGRWQAAVAAGGCLAVPLLFWIGAAILALVILRQGVREIGSLAIGCRTDGVWDRQLVKNLAQLTFVKAVDCPCARFDILAHGSDPEPAKRICAAIVGTGDGIVHAK